MKPDERPKWLKEICGNCGCTRGKHSADSHYSGSYSIYVPKNYCPNPESGMHRIDGPGTCFEPTGRYKEEV